MIEEILYEEQIAPPVCGTHLVEALVDVINGSISYVSVDQIHTQHDHQIKWTQSQIAMEKQLAKETQILTQTILSHCLQLSRVAQKVVGLEEATE